MDPRAPGGAGQPPPPQRAGSYGCGVPRTRPTLDPTGDGLRNEQRNEAAYERNRDTLGSPNVVKTEEEDDLPPAKRVKVDKDDVLAMEVDEVEVDKANKVLPGSPLPSLPKGKPTVKRLPGPRRPRMGIEPAARKAHGLDAPTAATRASLPPRNALDFFPWSGKSNTHPEDTLNDTVVKAGYYDKPQSANHNETNSAKPSIWPNLSSKNNQSLPMLGYLYQAVMEKRQQINRCTAPSTFKPPPRVTVTDTKREAWLRDLANPDVPLRKQSRTIPHGIRGKLLMEQCLSKDIPLQRAVWLAKCVGANELRAFRRKGVSGSAAASGEAKWVREWTLQVEQFLESVVATCGQQKDWQKSANYAVKLVSAIYAEKLLEKEHFLDWVVSSLSEATTEKLPIWIALVQVYWKDATAYSRRGRRLASSILEHLHEITQANKDVETALKIRLQKLVHVLAVSNRGCLILPQVWERYKYLLTPKTESEGEETALGNIIRRNERLAAPLYKTTANTNSPVMDLYQTLDTLGIDFDTEALKDKCLALVPNGPDLVSALLEWASTPYRTGIARIYHTSSIISSLHNAGYDTDSAILSYLSAAKGVTEQSARNIHRVVIDLIRLQSFSVGRFLQWLITSGMLANMEEKSCATGLIAALPASGLPPHVLNTRNTLLRRLGYTTDERAVVNEVLAKIDGALFEDTAWRFDPSIMPNDQPLSAQFGISHFVCNKAIGNAKELSPSITSFSFARAVIEHVQDISSLASLISAVSTTNDGALLATVCDTANLHASALAALGQFNALVDALGEQYILLRSQQPADRTFIHALRSLARLVPAKASLVKLLSDDLVMLDQQNSLAVCSPASDSLIGMHATSLDSDADIDAVFASGNTMDEQLMQRVFMRIVRRAADPVSPGPGPVSRVVGWLNQLRSVDGGGGVFDRLVLNYLHGLFKGSSGEEFSVSVVASLAVSESLSLGSIAEMTHEVDSAEIAAVVLESFLSTATSDLGLSECEQYRFRLQQDRCQIEQAASLLGLLRISCNSLDFRVENANLITFLIRCGTLRPGLVRQCFETGGSSDTLQLNAHRIMREVLSSGRSPEDAPASTEEFDLKGLVHMANVFSIRYCIEPMRYLRSQTSWSADEEDLLEAAVLEAFTDRSDVWPQLLEFAGHKTNLVVHGWARDQLLALAGRKTGLDDFDTQEHWRRCLEMLAVTSDVAETSEDVAAMHTVMEKLKEVAVKFSDTSDEMDSKTELDNLLNQLHILLDLTTTHIHAHPAETDTSQTARMNLLTTLCTLFTHPALQLHQETTSYLADLASVLADNLPQTTDSPLKLPKHLPHDPHLIFFLPQDSTPTDPWLALAYHDRPTPAPQQGTQQQRALAKHSSQTQTQAPSLSTRSPQPLRWPSAGLGLLRQDSRVLGEVKTAPFVVRRWEVFGDATPVLGENDGGLGLGLFGGRKV